MERRRRRCLERGLLPCLLAERQPLREDRLRGVLRLPGQPAVHRAGRERKAPDHLADGRNPGSHRAAGPARSGAGPGHRALDALAVLRLAPGRPRRGAGGADRGVARRAARGRAPHAPRWRSPATPPTAPCSSASGSRAPATKARPGSWACCTRPVPTRAYRRRACGRRSPTTSPLPPTRRRRWRCCGGWNPGGGLGRRVGARVGGVRLRASDRHGGAERPRHPGVRRTPRAGRRLGGTGHLAGGSLGGGPGARIPALPAPAGRGQLRPAGR